MNRDQLWAVIDKAREALPNADADEIAAGVTDLLAALPPADIQDAVQLLWDLMAESYRTDVWGAAYLINGGASDDGFDYFRGWLICQGRTTFEAAVTDPDSLATVPAVIAAVAQGEDLWGEDILNAPHDAHLRRTGQDLPPDAFTIDYPDLDEGWDFDDDEAARRHLPHLTRLLES
ncbi:DUF4240 domain-containing protein [Herbidospora daliensis]|uniref:DUF4240 domain-containing protein n=1 Tax=Herbidospora daliensis TaxID=295585 RepID=UPI0007835709|nr:DUF4240 domain-containing protein [Herbidospora daliensis]